MIVRRTADARVFAADEAMTITNLLPSDDSPRASVVTAHLNGPHTLRVNHRSDKIYLVLAGRLEAEYGGTKETLGRSDSLLVPAGEPVALVGYDAELVIVVTPGFAPDDEEMF